MSTVSFHPTAPNASTPWAYAKRFHPVEVESLNHLAEGMQHRVWSPIVWDEGTRKRMNFRSAHVLALDFDDGRLTLPAAISWALVSRLKCIVGTSKSHQKEKSTPGGKLEPPCDRFRLVLFWADGVFDRDQYEWNCQKAVKKFPADRSATDAARFFFPCREIVYISEGRELSPYPVPADFLNTDERIEIGQAKARYYASSKTMPLWALNALESGTGVGGRHRLVYRLGANLIAYGLSEEEIVQMVLKSPLAAIGREDVGRAVRNGIERARRERTDFESRRRGEEGRPQGKDETGGAKQVRDLPESRSRG